jgi:hypothetical protein
MALHGTVPANRLHNCIPFWHIQLKSRGGIVREHGWDEVVPTRYSPKDSKRGSARHLPSRADNHQDNYIRFSKGQNSTPVPYPRLGPRIFPNFVTSSAASSQAPAFSPRENCRLLGQPRAGTLE